MPQLGGKDTLFAVPVCVTLFKKKKKGNLEPLRYGLPVRVVLHAAEQKKAGLLRKKDAHTHTTMHQASWSI